LEVVVVRAEVVEVLIEVGAGLVGEDEDEVDDDEEPPPGATAPQRPNCAWQPVPQYASPSPQNQKSEQQPP